MRRIHREENNNKKKAIIGILALLSTTGGALVVNNLMSDEEIDNKSINQPKNKIERKREDNTKENKNSNVDKTEDIKIKSDDAKEEKEVKTIPQNNTSIKPTNVINPSNDNIPKFNNIQELESRNVVEQSEDTVADKKEESKINVEETKTIEKVEQPKVNPPKIVENEIKDTVKVTENETSSINNENIVLTKEVINEKPEVKTIESVKDIEITEKDLVTYTNKVETVDIPFETKITENLSLKKGEKRVVKKGVAGRKEITTKVTKVNGTVYKTEVISEVDSVSPVTEEIEVGTFDGTEIRVDKEEERVTEYKVIEKYVSTLPKGERKVVTKGKQGVDIDVYSETFINGELTDRKLKESRIKTQAVDEVIEIGTYEEITTEETEREVVNFDTIITNDDTLPDGEISLDQDGVNGVIENTYVIITNQDGEVVSKTLKTSNTVTVKQDKKVRVGSKRTETVKEKVDIIEPTVEYVDTEDLDYGVERVGKQGTSGYTLKTIERYYGKDGVLLGENVINTEVVEPVNTIVKRGIKNKIASRTVREDFTETLSYSTTIINDDTLMSTYRVVEKKGINGSRSGVRITTINEDGSVNSSEENVVETQPINEVVRVGTIKSINTEIREELTSEQPNVVIEYVEGMVGEKEEIVEEGTAGKIIKTYKVTEYVGDSRESKKELIDTRVIEATPKKIIRPNKTLVRNEEEERVIPITKKYIDDSELDFGIVVKDRDGVVGRETRGKTVYKKMVKKNGVYVEETEVIYGNWNKTKEMQPEVYRRGTKEVVERKKVDISYTIPHRIIYKPSDEIAFNRDDLGNIAPSPGGIEGETNKKNEEAGPGYFNRTLTIKYVNGQPTEVLNIVAKDSKNAKEEEKSVYTKLNVDFSIVGINEDNGDTKRFSSIGEIIDFLNSSDGAVYSHIKSVFVPDSDSNTPKLFLPENLNPTKENESITVDSIFSTVGDINIAGTSENNKLVADINNAWEEFPNVLTSANIGSKLLTYTYSTGNNISVDILDDKLHNVNNTEYTKKYNLKTDNSVEGYNIRAEETTFNTFYTYTIEENNRIDYGKIKFEIPRIIKTARIEYNKYELKKDEESTKYIYVPEDITESSTGEPITITIGTKNKPITDSENNTETIYDVSKEANIHYKINKDKADGFYTDEDLTSPVNSENINKLIAYKNIVVEKTKIGEKVAKTVDPPIDDKYTIPEIYHNIADKGKVEKIVDKETKIAILYPDPIIEYREDVNRVIYKTEFKPKYKAEEWNIYKYKNNKDEYEEIKREPVLLDEDTKEHKYVELNGEDDEKVEVVTKEIRPKNIYVEKTFTENTVVNDYYVANNNIIYENNIPLKSRTVNVEKVYRIKQTWDGESYKDTDEKTFVKYTDSSLVTPRPIEIGTKREEISTENVTISYDTEKRLDNKVLEETVIQNGENGTGEKITTTVTIGTLDTTEGNVDFDNYINRYTKVNTNITKEPKSKIVKVPKYKIKHKIVNQIVPFEIKYIDDPNLEFGTEVIETHGVNGNKVTIEYSVLSRNNVNSPFTVIDESTVDITELKNSYIEKYNLNSFKNIEATKQIVRRGTKVTSTITETVDDNSVDIPVIIIDDSTIAQSEEKDYIIKQHGKKGTITTTYKTVNGEKTEDVVGKITKTAPKPTIKIRGTKPIYKENTTVSYIEPTIVRVKNNRLQKGKEITHTGKKGTITTKIRQSQLYGKIINTEILSEVVTTKAVNTIIEEGTFENNSLKKDEVVKFKTEYIEDDNMLKNDSTIIQNGEDGVNTITYRYVLENGYKTDGIEVLNTESIKKVKNKIVKIGTKVEKIDKTPTMREEIAQPEDEIRYNSNLEIGRQNVIDEGQPGYREIRYKKIFVKDRLVATEEYSSVIVQQPRKRIIEIGTKPKVVEKRTLIKRESYWDFFPANDERHEWAKQVPETFEDITKMDVEKVFTLSKIKKVGVQKYDKATVEYLYSQLDAEWINEEIIRLTNIYRREKNLPELVSIKELKEPAQIRSDELALNGHIRFNNQKHTRKDGAPWHTVLDRSRFRAAGENLTMLYFGNPFQYISEKYIAHTFFQQWKDSPKHWENMMDPKSVGMYIAIQFGENSLYNNEPYNANAAIGTMLIDKTKRK